QLVVGVDLAVKAVQTTLEQSTSSLKRSEIISSLAEISRVVKSSTAEKRAVLVVSDMIEHSSVTSFYGGGNSLRHIDPVKELKTAETRGLIGNFDGAAIYVLGAGILPPAPASVGA